MKNPIVTIIMNQNNENTSMKKLGGRFKYLLRCIKRRENIIRVINSELQYKMTAKAKEILQDEKKVLKAQLDKKFVSLDYIKDLYSKKLEQELDTVKAA